MALSVVIQRTASIFQAGKLRHRIRIVQPTLKQDSTGGTAVTEDVPIATVWASVEALSGADKFAAHEFISQVTHQVIIRWRPGITAKMRIVFKNRLFMVEAVLNPDERHKMLVLLCIEIADSVMTPMGG